VRIYEITKPEDQLALLKSIMDNTWRTISQQRAQQIQPAPPMQQPMQARPIPRSYFTAKPVAKPKAAISKKAPYAAPPKPLPKAKPLPQTPIQIKHQQHKHQQNYAQAVKKAFDKDTAKMPKSLQPLPTNIISPIGGGDPEFNKKLELARKQGEQNRSNGSIPLSN